MNIRRNRGGFSTNWEEVFNRYDVAGRVERHGYADLTADDLRAVFEPRLLTKVDHSHSLPLIMKEHGFSILTLSTSSWRIGPFNIFKELPDWKSPDHTVPSRSLPSWLESLSPDSLTGEGAVINAASASGILQEFCGEELVPTVSGKGRSGDFSFQIQGNNRTYSVDVRGAQIEIDAGYEGKANLFLFEAKKHISIDFNVRQLYYPFRAWSQRVRKTVRPIFLTFANGVFDLTEYQFTDAENFSSGEIVRHSRFMLGMGLPSEKEIVELAKTSRSTQSKRLWTDIDVPFPQADDFERIIDLVEFLAERPRTQEEITTEYEFAPRQSDYYFNAARYLGLAMTERGDDGKTYRQTTALAKEIIALPYKQRQIRLAALVLAVEPIAEIYLDWVSRGEVPRLDKVEDLFTRSSSSRGLSGATLHRRAQTILAWVSWLKRFDD